MNEKQVYISLGSNLGKKKQNLEKALLLIQKKASLLTLSSFYETEPIGFTHQDSFLNIVAEIKTSLNPFQLLCFFQEIEKKMGRKKTFLWGPRIIDIDILFYENLVIHTPQLKIPHKKVFQRRFVLEPLWEINFKHPKLLYYLNQTWEQKCEKLCEN